MTTHDNRFLVLGKPLLVFKLKYQRLRYLDNF